MFSAVLQRNNDTVEAWDNKFKWTSDHLKPQDYASLKYSYDTLAEECLDLLNNISQEGKDGTVYERETQSETPALETGKTPVIPKRDLFRLLRDNYSAHPKLKELWSEVTSVPSWVDWDQIARGQEVFYRYGGATLTGLAFQSLLGGMGANRVVETLSRTGGFGVKVARRRLLETTQHVLECTKSPEAIQPPHGEGFASSIRVRLLHAAVRNRIMNLVKRDPLYYDVNRYGMPINDIDCVATISVFSASIIFLSLPRQGLFLTAQEKTDYIALWRLVAHYTGTPTSFFETPAKAKAIMETLQMYEIDPSPTSQILARNIVRALENTPPAYASRDFLHAQTYWLNGPKLAKALAIPPPPSYYYVLIAGQCIFFMALCYTYRSIPYLDRRKIKALRRIFWHVIVESREFGLGGITAFEFKHVPSLGLLTERAEDEEERKTPMAWEGVERRSIKTLAIAGVLAIAGSWVSWNIASRLFDKFQNYI